jgi:hypothetical protein
LTQAAYTVNLGDSGHSLLATLNGAWLEEAIATPAPGLSYDCAGLFGTICQTVNPTWRHNMRLTWISPWEVDVSLQWRHIGGTKLDQNDSDPDLQFALWGEFDEFNAELPDMDYLDVSAIWEINGKFTLRAGVTNVLDKDPPVVGTEISGTGSANTYPTSTRWGGRSSCRVREVRQSRTVWSFNRRSRSGVRLEGRSLLMALRLRSALPRRRLKRGASPRIAHGPVATDIAEALIGTIPGVATPNPSGTGRSSPTWPRRASPRLHAPGRRDAARERWRRRARPMPGGRCLPGGRRQERDRSPCRRARARRVRAGISPIARLR